MATTKTAEYATLTLLNEDEFVSAGSSFTFTVAPTLKSSKALYQPETTYKLFVRLPKGVTAKLPVSYAPNTVHVAAAEGAWTGAPGEYSAIPDGWEEGSDQQAEAYKLRLLATWTSAKFTDFTNTHPLGWDITVTVDKNHGSTPVVIQATLIAMQDNHVKAALSAVPLSVTITSAGPEFASVQLPGADFQSDKYIMAAETHEPFRVRTVLKQPATTAKMLVRWQVKGAGDSWNLAEPDGLEVAGGIGDTHLRDFTIQNNYKDVVTLLLSCAVPVSAGDQPNWGLPSSVVIDFEAGMLTVDDAVVKVGSGKITLTCDIHEPSDHVQFDKLEISYDSGGSWQAVSTSITGNRPTYHVGYEITQRDFSQGLLLRCWDKLNRPIRQPARFDLATFLTVTWVGASSQNEDINLGEKFGYMCALDCALNTILPPLSLYFLMPESAIETEPTGASGYLLQNSKQLGYWTLIPPLAGWHGTGTATLFYEGPIQTGVIDVTCVVRKNTALLGKVFPAAQVSFRGEDLLTQPVEFTELSKAVVFRPAPAFQFIPHLPTHTNRYVLTFKGNFLPELEASPALVFTVVADNGAEKRLAATSITELTQGYFELSLSDENFTAFNTDGEHHVRITIHRQTDTRKAERSSHSETFSFRIDNSAASFEDTSIQVEAGFLRVEGTVVAPSKANPVKQVLLSLDGSGHGTREKPLLLTKDSSDPLELRSTFDDSLELALFEGALRPTLKAVTDSNTETPLNLFFSTAMSLLDIKLKINGTEVTDGGSLAVTAGTLNFAITVTSLVGLPQRLNMFMTLGKSFTAGKSSDPTSPDSGKGTLIPTEPPKSWNGLSSYQFFQTEGLVKGATFSVSGTIGLRKTANASEDDESLVIAFTETDSLTKKTFNAIDKDDGPIFKARLVPG